MSTPKSKGSPDRPWLPEGAIEKATLDPRTTLVLGEGEGGMWTVAALATLTQRLYPEMASVLRELEWAGDSATSMCPECGRRPPRSTRSLSAAEFSLKAAGHQLPDGGHAPDCRLSALLRSLP